VFLRQRPVRACTFGAAWPGEKLPDGCVFESVPIERKSRVHFHRFMQDIHHRLRDLQGRENPLEHAARDIRNSCVCCASTNSMSPTSAMRC